MADSDEIVNSGEKVISEIRRHWISVLPMMLGWLVLGLIALYGFYAAGRYNVEIGRIGPVALVLVGLSALIALAVLLAYVTFWVYRENRMIITEKCLYVVTQNSLFSRRVEQFGFDRLQEVTSEQNGFFASNLDYGSVLAETAGDDKNLTFTYAPHPRELASWIMQHHRDIADTPEGKTAIAKSQP